MKKLATIMLAMVLLIGLLRCSNQKQITNSKSQTEKIDVREAVWNQLTPKEKKQVRTWQDSKIEKVFLDEGSAIFCDKSYIGKEVYLIEFKVTDKTAPQSILVKYASMDNHKLIGFGPTS